MPNNPDHKPIVEQAYNPIERRHHRRAMIAGGAVATGVLAATLGLSALAGQSDFDQEMQNQQYEQTKTLEMFRPTGFFEGGEITVNIKNLTNARTLDTLLRIRLGQNFKPIDTNTISALDQVPIGSGQSVIISQPTEVDLRSQGLGEYFTGTIRIKGQNNPQAVIIPKDEVLITKAGIDNASLSRVDDSSQLDVARPAQP